MLFDVAKDGQKIAPKWVAPEEEQEPRPRRAPRKAGFTPPAHARVTEVAPGVFVAPVAGSAPIMIGRGKGKKESSPALSSSLGGPWSSIVFLTASTDISGASLVSRACGA